MAGCTDDEGANHALRIAGYKNIQLTGWSMWSCSKDDGSCTGFVAIAPDGERVEGAVGCGYLFKGCTVRIK